MIQMRTFNMCYTLQSITIPASVEFIYQEAFANCPSLKKIETLPTTPPFLYDNSFTSFSVPVKVPKGCKQAYQVAQGWKNFTNIYDREKYILTYMVDGAEYKSYEIEEDAVITPEPTPTKEGYTFSGWSEIPETMPAHNVTVTGTFVVNRYKVSYFVDNNPFYTDMVEYGAKIIPPTVSEREGYDFAWRYIPDTMPAYDISIYGTYTVKTGIQDIIKDEKNKTDVYTVGGKRVNKLKKGLNILRMRDGTTKKVVVK